MIWNVIRPIVKAPFHLGRSMERHRRVVRSTLRSTFSKFRPSDSMREKSPGGLRTAPEGPWTIFCAWNATLDSMKKFTEECFAQHVDGAPSTAPSSVTFLARKTYWPSKNKISAEQRLIVAPSVKWSLHQGSNDVLNKDHEILQARNEAASFLT